MGKDASSYRREAAALQASRQAAADKGNMHKAALPELHAFLGKYGHKAQHADEHILKAVAGTNTVAGAKRALGSHPAFFGGAKGTTPVAPGAHPFTSGGTAHGAPLASRGEAHAGNSYDTAAFKAENLSRTANSSNSTAADHFAAAKAHNDAAQHPDASKGDRAHHEEKANSHTNTSQKIEFNQAMSGGSKPSGPTGPAAAATAKAHEATVQANQDGTRVSHMDATKAHQEAAKAHAAEGNKDAAGAHRTSRDAHDNAQATISKGQRFPQVEHGKAEIGRLGAGEVAKRSAEGQARLDAHNAKMYGITSAPRDSSGALQISGVKSGAETNKATAASIKANVTGEKADHQAAAAAHRAAGNTQHASEHDFAANHDYHTAAGTPGGHSSYGMPMKANPASTEAGRATRAAQVASAQHQAGVGSGQAAHDAHEAAALAHSFGDRAQAQRHESAAHALRYEGKATASKDGNSIPHPANTGAHSNEPGGHMSAGASTRHGMEDHEVRARLAATAVMPAAKPTPAGGGNPANAKYKPLSAGGKQPSAGQVSMRNRVANATHDRRGNASASIVRSGAPEKKASGWAAWRASIKK
jgi:hypothetical protein